MVDMLNTPQTKNTAHKWIKQAIDILLPPRCIGTGEIVSAPGVVSPDFWTQLSFIETPFCSTCGLPFDVQMPSGTLCAACIDNPPEFDQSRSAVIYNDASRKLILSFKYGDRLNAVTTFIPWLKRTGANLIDTSDIIVPVPLHKSRLWQRRYNQAAIIALSLAKETQKICLVDALERVRATAPQKGLTKKDRYKNVLNAFRVYPESAENLKGKNILLIDDVFTSGATLNECARVLKKSGANRVNILTIARVTRDEF